MTYVFFPNLLKSIADSITVAGAAINFSVVLSLLLFGVLFLGVLAIFAIVYRSLLSHFKIKEIKLPMDATITSGEDSNETVFNKYMDEIVYFFEETKFQFVFFEDLDRLERSSIFVHLRELNTILNNYNVIKRPIVFIYAVRDDIFSDTDRTKFFEFIVPVIPIINSTNSGEILLGKLDDSQKMGIQHNISQNFVLDVSPYISDMRILQNSYNEFVIYKKTLREEQNLKLLDEPMMALLIFKNLYPRDFADIQMEQGVIKQAFVDKQKHLKIKLGAIQNEVDELEEVLEGVPSETLEKNKELKISLLCEITGWKGMATQINVSGKPTTNGSAVMQDSFDFSQWNTAGQCSGTYYRWDGNGGYSFTFSELSNICASYAKRAKEIRLIEESKVAETQKRVENLKLQLSSVSGWSTKQFIEQLGVENVLSDEVMKNKLLVFLIRRGYIDEKYGNYINYFKGNTITKDDMNFILSVKNMEPQPFSYGLTKTSMVVQKLQAYEFGQKAIYNFDLMECLLISDAYSEKLNAFINQLVDEDDQSWKFIDEFVESTEHKSYFIKLLASVWPNMWGYIVDNAVLTYERKIRFLSLLITSVSVEIIESMNNNNILLDFFEQNEDILQQLASIEGSKIVGVIRALHVTFRKILIESVPEDVLVFIFDNDYYELNSHMIELIVGRKNKDLIPELESKNYSTIIKLNYDPLIKYVRENLPHYVDAIVLAKERVFDEEKNILDLLERCIDNPTLCIKIIEHEEFCLADITCCCSNQIAEKKTEVNSLWTTLLKKDKILPSWNNVRGYWSVFLFDQSLLDFIENHTKDLVIADNQCLGDDFIREFIGTTIADETLEILLPSIRMDSFDIVLANLAKNKISIMIACKYFDFTVARYEELKNSFPDLCVEFILHNQADYISVMDDIQMDSNLLENLLLSDKIEKATAQTLLDTYGSQYMTSSIAGNLHVMKMTISLKIFNAAWSCLDDLGKQKLMLEHLELLDADALHSCFMELEKWYSDLLDRSKQHGVELENTPINQILAERLKTVDYVTSYQFKEKKEFDPASEVEIVSTVILCRIKAVK